MRLEYSAATTANSACGNSGNEDAYLVPQGVRQDEASDHGVVDSHGCLFGVSDGIHCSSQAKQASRRLLEFLADVHAQYDGQPIGWKLREVYQRFTEVAAQDQRARGMTATLVAVEIADQRATIYNVGDSAAWLIRSMKAERLTRDHTILERMLDEGDVTPEEANTLGSIYDGLDRYFAALPGEDKPVHDQLDIDLQPGDVILLGSDGLAALSGNELTDHIMGDFGTASRRLVEAAIDLGSDDNITALAVRVVATD